MSDEKELTEDEWYDEVVRICKERDYAEWFYADREAWLDYFRDEQPTPEEAIRYQLECAS